MKKLLGILGTITIAGSGMTGIVGNAPTSAKNEINYLQTNSFKKFSRIKRNVHPSGLNIEYDWGSQHEIKWLQLLVRHYLILF